MSGLVGRLTGGGGGTCFTRTTRPEEMGAIWILRFWRAGGERDSRMGEEGIRGGNQHQSCGDLPSSSLPIHRSTPHTLLPARVPATAHPCIPLGSFALLCTRTNSHTLPRARTHSRTLAPFRRAPLLSLDNGAAPVQGPHVKGPVRPDAPKDDNIPLAHTRQDKKKAREGKDEGAKMRRMWHVGLGVGRRVKRGSRRRAREGRAGGCGCGVFYLC